jgi:hypothetical protein
MSENEVKRFLANLVKAVVLTLSPKLFVIYTGKHLPIKIFPWQCLKHTDLY